MDKRFCHPAFSSHNPLSCGVVSYEEESQEEEQEEEEEEEEE